MTPLELSIINGSSSYLQINRTTIKAWMSLNFVKILSLIMALSALEHLKILFNIVNSVAPSFLIGSSQSLQVTRTAIKSQMGLKSGQIRPCTVKLAAL